MPKEPEDEIGTLASPRQSAVHLRTECVNAHRRGLAEMLLDSAVAALLGVHVWGIWREPFQVDGGMLGEIRLHDQGAMRGGAVPDQDHRPGEVSPAMWQGDPPIRVPEGLRHRPLEEAARQGQSDGRRELPALAQTPHTGCVPPRCPRRTGFRLQCQPRLIANGSLRPGATRRFVMRGQACLSQARTRSAWRSLA
jgi:hypothetical protein